MGVTAPSSLRRILAGGAAAALALALPWTASAAEPCPVSPSSRYLVRFADTPATRVNDLADRVFVSFVRDGRGQEVFAEVASKFNQPRTVEGVSGYTTPHRGTDFIVQWTNEDSYVSASADGTLVSTGASWKVGERIDASHHLSYMHVVPLAGFVPGRVVVAGERIARVGAPSENGGFNEHVHFGMTSDAAFTGWRPISPYFADAAGWRGGRDLEFLSFPSVGAGNVLSVTGYTLTGGAWGKCFQPLAGVTVFFRKKGAATWRSAPMEAAATVDPGGGARPWVFRFDLDAAGAPGDAVEWYVAGYRDPDAVPEEYDLALDVHNYALFPAGFAHPVDAPAAYPAGRVPYFATTTLK